MTSTVYSLHRNPLESWRNEMPPDPVAREALGTPQGDGRRLLLVGDDMAVRAVVADWLTGVCRGTAVIGAPLDVPLVERQPDVLLHRLGRSVAAVTGMPDGIPLPPDDLRQALPGWLARAGARHGAIVIFEGVDQRGAPPDWLPSHAAPRVTVVATAGPGETAERLAAAGWHLVDVAGETSVPAGANDAEALLKRLWASPEGVNDRELDRLDPDGNLRRRARGWLRRRPGRIGLAHEGLRRWVGSELLPAEARRAGWLTGLAEGADDPVAAGSWLVEAEAWQALAARLAQPSTLDRWSRSAPALAALWRRLPVQDLAWPRLAAALARAREAPPTETETRRQLAAVELLDALDRADDAAELRSAVLRWLAAANGPPVALADALHRDGAAALDAGETGAARQRLEQALGLRRRHLGGSSEEALSTEHTLAMVREAEGDLEGAEHGYRRLLATAIERHGECHPRIIPYLANLAAAQRAANRLEPARDNLDAALRIGRVSLGADHPTTAALMDSMAGLLYGGGDLEGAESTYREAVATTERLFGPDHEATAASLHNLGTCLDGRAAYREAESCFRRALDIRHRLCGDYHADTASTRHNLAGVMEVTGRGREAEALYREAIQAWELVVGEEHPATATSVNNLADLLRENGDYEEAERLYRRNLATWGRLYGHDHPNTLMTAAELGGLCADAGRPDEAERLLSPALDGLRARLGVTSGLYVDAALRLARLRADSGRRAEALALLDETLQAAAGSTAILAARYQKVRRHRDAIAGNGRPETRS